MQFWNMTKTVLLLGGLTGLFLLMGSAIGGTGGLVIAFVFATLFNMGAWWFSASIALRMSGAREVSPQEAPALHQTVEWLAREANIPKPKVYIIDSDMPNAFATGRNPQNGAVAVTTGITHLLNSDELAGVIAHEIAHIKNRDTLIASLAATVAGAVTMIADLAMWSLIFGGFGGDDEEDGGLAGLAGGVLMIFLAPIAALIIQMMISRSREYSADYTGARILGDPLPLARALEKIEAWAEKRPANFGGSPAASHLYIIPPMTGGLLGLFRTHPPTEERVKRLHQMLGQEQVYAS
jgi:heat shock protein HtpX